MRTEQLQHLCRQGPKCKARVRDGEEFRGAGVERPDALCPGCEQSAFRSITFLFHDWIALEESIPRGRARTTGEKVRSTPGRSCPIPLDVDSLQTDIETQTLSWANRLTGGDPVPTPRRECVQKCVAAISSKLGTLVDMPRMPVTVMRPMPDGGDYWTQDILDGVDAVLSLAKLHHYTLGILGLIDKPERLPDPCPYCGRRALTASGDQSLVRCLMCRQAWDKDHFALLYSVLDFERQQVRVRA